MIFAEYLHSGFYIDKSFVNNNTFKGITYSNEYRENRFRIMSHLFP